MKYFLVLVLICSLYIGCEKESMLINDEGAVFNFEAIRIDSGIDIGNIYETQNFAAFTDLTNFNGTWYAVFRIGTSHFDGEDGQIKVLTSKDGNEWHVMDNIASKKQDLRAPHLTIDSSKNDLYLTYFGKQHYVVNYSCKLDKTTNTWGPPKAIQYDNSDKTRYVFWRYTYHKGKLYSISYRTPLDEKRKAKNLALFTSDEDFFSYKFSGEVDIDGACTETTLRFTQTDSMYFIPRTESVNSPVGFSIPFYNIVQWNKDPFSSVLASPNFLFYKDKLLVTARDSRRGSFRFFCYDIKSKTLEKTYTFPSGYETGYGGMSFNPSNPDELWITYYSVNNTQSLIKLAKIDLLKFL